MVNRNDSENANEQAMEQRQGTQTEEREGDERQDDHEEKEEQYGEKQGPRHDKPSGAYPPDSIRDDPYRVAGIFRNSPTSIASTSQSYPPFIGNASSSRLRPMHLGPLPPAGYCVSTAPPPPYYHMAPQLAGAYLSFSSESPNPNHRHRPSPARTWNAHDYTATTSSGSSSSPAAQPPPRESTRVSTVGCTCKKSRCLKLYCACFASSTTCGSTCKCVSCSNNPQQANMIHLARRNVLERNPNAFHDKFLGHLPRGVSSLRPSPPPPPPRPPAIVLYHHGARSHPPRRSSSPSLQSARPKQSVRPKQPLSSPPNTRKEAIESHTRIGHGEAAPSMTRITRPRFLSGAEQVAERSWHVNPATMNDSPSSLNQVSSSSPLTLSLVSQFGCKCRRSFCLKKYCECYQNESRCGLNCRCTNCQNQPDGTTMTTSNATTMALSKTGTHASSRPRPRPSPLPASVVHPALTGGGRPTTWVQRPTLVATPSAVELTPVPCEGVSTQEQQQQKQKLATPELLYQADNVDMCEDDDCDDCETGKINAIIKQDYVVPTNDDYSGTDRMAIMAAVAMTELSNCGSGQLAALSADAGRRQSYPVLPEKSGLENSHAGEDDRCDDNSICAGRYSGLRSRSGAAEEESRVPIKKRKHSTVLADDEIRAVVGCTASLSVESRNPSPASASQSNPTSQGNGHCHNLTPTSGYPSTDASNSYLAHYHGTHMMYRCSPPPPPPPGDMQFHQSCRGSPTAYGGYTEVTMGSTALSAAPRNSPPRGSPVLPCFYAHTPSPPNPPPLMYHHHHRVGSSPPPTFRQSPPPLFHAATTTYEEVIRTTGLPKSLSFRKICSRCGKTRSEHGELGFGHKCLYQECGKCGGGVQVHNKAGEPMGILCQLTVKDGAIPGMADSYRRKIHELATHADLQRELARRRKGQQEQQHQTAQ